MVFGIVPCMAIKANDYENRNIQQMRYGRRTAPVAEQSLLFEIKHMTIQTTAKNNHVYIIIIFLAIICLMAFGRIAGNDFINFDDNIYITKNNFIKEGITGQSITWALGSFLSSTWQPVTWISHMLDWSMFGAHAPGHHIISLLLHTGAVIFLFLFLFRTTHHLWCAAFAAAFFGLHPLRVESVAWAAERKDVLSMFFGMACLYAYAFYAEHPKPSRYVFCLCLFALALMSKSMLVTLPLMMLLLDYWPMKRFQIHSPRDGFKSMLLWEKLPFFILSIASGMITIWAQYKTSVTHLSLPSRVLNAIIAYVTYLIKIFLPFDLAVFYPFVDSFPPWQLWGSILTLIGITFFVVYFLKKMPFLFVGWCWYLGALVPVSGMISVNAPMADHFTYLPSIGIAIMFSWSLSSWFPHDVIRKKILFPAGIIVLTLLMVLTWQQCGYWKNSLTLFNHALQVTKNNDLAHNNLAGALIAAGRNQEAIDHYSQAINIKPHSDVLYYNRGVAYVKIRQYQLALDDYSKAIRLKPDETKYYTNRGIAYVGLRQYQKAIEDFSAVIHSKEDFADAYSNRGLASFNQGKKEAGCRDVKKACELGNCRALGLAQDKGLCR